MVAIVYFLDIFDLNDGAWINEVTLAILALLAYGRINDQKNFDSINHKIDSSIQTPYMEDYPDTLLPDMNDTSELWIVGCTLSRTIETHYTMFKKKLEKGEKIRVLLITPDSEASGLAAMRDKRPRQKSFYDSAITNTLADFCQLAELTKGDIKVRTINAVLSSGCYAMCPTSSDGKMYIEHYAYKSEAGDIPKLILEASDGFLYETYKNQLLTLWKHATTWPCVTDRELNQHSG